MKISKLIAVLTAISIITLSLCSCGYEIVIRKKGTGEERTTTILLDDIEKELKRKGKELKLRFDDNIMISKNNPKKKYAGYCFATELLKYKEKRGRVL